MVTEAPAETEVPLAGEVIETAGGAEIWIVLTGEATTLFLSS